MAVALDPSLLSPSAANPTEPLLPAHLPDHSTRSEPVLEASAQETTQKELHELGPSLRAGMRPFDSHGVMGVEIRKTVPFGAAEQAGILVGDVVIAVAGHPLRHGLHDLHQHLATCLPGDVLELSLRRSTTIFDHVHAVRLGAPLFSHVETVSVELGVEHLHMFDSPSMSQDHVHRLRAIAGLNICEQRWISSCDEASRIFGGLQLYTGLKCSSKSGAVVINGVEAGSPAEWFAHPAVGKGSVLVSVDHSAPFAKLDDLRKVLATKQPGERMVLQVRDASAVPAGPGEASLALVDVDLVTGARGKSVGQVMALRTMARIDSCS